METTGIMHMLRGHQAEHKINSNIIYLLIVPVYYSRHQNRRVISKAPMQYPVE